MVNAYGNSPAAQPGEKQGGLMRTDGPSKRRTAGRTAGPPWRTGTSPPAGCSGVPRPRSPRCTPRRGEEGGGGRTPLPGTNFLIKSLALQQKKVRMKTCKATANPKQNAREICLSRNSKYQQLTKCLNHGGLARVRQTSNV